MGDSDSDSDAGEWFVFTSLGGRAGTGVEGWEPYAIHIRVTNAGEVTALRVEPAVGVEDAPPLEAGRLAELPLQELAEKALRNRRG